MHPSRIFDKPTGFNTVALPALRVTGALPGYEQGSAYEGRLDIEGAVGACTVELLDNNLPPGSTARVEGAEVVIEWPPYSPVEPRANILNHDFQRENLVGWWDRQGNSWGVENSIDLNGSGTPPNWATDGDYVAVMRGIGRFDHILESIRYPAIPGAPLMARSLWDQGPSNKDNVNLWTALVFYDAANTPTEFRGDRIHDRTNKSRHWSTVNVVTPENAVTQAVRLIAGRRNSRNRWIAATVVETTGFTFAEGVANGDDFYLTLRVFDSANRVAYWTGVIPYGSFYITSKLYQLIQFESMGLGFKQEDMLYKIFTIPADGDDGAGVSFALAGFQFIALETPAQLEYAGVGFELVDLRYSEFPRPDQSEPAGLAYTMAGFNFSLVPNPDAHDAGGLSYTLQGFTYA